MSSDLDRYTLIFQELGISRIEGRILCSLLAGNLSAKDLERAADLRQPEISLGAERLVKRGWVSEKLDISVGRGRPQKIYCLENKKKIYNDFCIVHKTNVKNKEANLEVLKELLKVN